MYYTVHQLTKMQMLLQGELKITLKMYLQYFLLRAAVLPQSKVFRSVIWTQMFVPTLQIIIEFKSQLFQLIITRHIHK